MTSKNSSWGEGRISQKEMFRRRKWPIACITFFYFVSCIIVPLVSKSNYYDSEKATWTGRLVREYFEHPSMAVFFAFFSGLLLSLQGFSYLHSKKMLDFYESEPYTKKQRFTSISLNSLCIFTVISFVLFFGGALLTGIGGDLTGSIAVGVIKGYLLVWSLAASGFAVGTLSVMLTGNIIIAMIAVSVFSAYEFAARLLSTGLRDAFILTMAERTWRESTFYPTSPLVNSMIIGPSRLVIGVNLIYMVVVMALAAWAFSKRKNESAGTAVVFAPVRHIVKIAMGILIFMYAFVVGRETNSSLTQGIIVAILFSFIMCMVMEIIYDFNIAAFKNRLIENVLVVAAGILMIFCMAAAGKRYDRYLPRAEDVVSSAVMPDGTYNYYDDDGDYTGNFKYARKYMKLTDTDDVLKVAENGIETTLNGQSSGDVDYVDELRRVITVFWRLKNGKTVSRTYTVNAKDVSRELQNITTQEAFREGFFQIYHDKYALDRVNDKGWSIYYEACSNDSSGPWYKYAEASDVQKIYKDFHEAYMKDVQDWSYSFSSEAKVDGTLYVGSPSANDIDEGYSHDDIGNNYNLTFPIYRDFTNTITYLQSVDLYYPSGNPEADGIFGYES